MFGWDRLKPSIQISHASVECPVRDCPSFVKRQRGSFQRHPDFRCPQHGIYISPSTFEYETDSDNMLWAADTDLALWRAINAPGVKRENRIARDNSEDAVTWNVFRFLELHGLVGEFTNLVAGETLAATPRVIYWSYCQSSRRAWSPLLDAAQFFGEGVEYRSEPDVVIDDDRVLAFVENKFLGGNRKPSKARYPKRYTTAGPGWFAKVFSPSTTFEEVAVTDELYQLMRLWLLGSWIADQSGKRFLLVNVVRSQSEDARDTEAQFGQYISASPNRRFVLLTWERLFAGLVRSKVDIPDSNRLEEYFANKTIGYPYDARNVPTGLLQRAFDLTT